MDTNSKYKSSKNTKTRLKTQQLEDIKMDDNNTIEDVFPKFQRCLPEFNKIRCSCTRSRNYQHLERLLLFYTQNILSSVAEKNVKFSDAINFKNHINSTLTFFHLYWLDIKQDVADHSLYLSKISALLNVYINMELETSMKEITPSHDQDSKIAAKILAALYIYLHNSEEHIFRVLLRIEHTTKKYTRICILIFTKSFTNFKTKTASITDVAYIRYLLAFKMWKKMEEMEEIERWKREDKRERINKLALMLLGPCMPELQDKLLKFVPRPPMGQENETLWLIQSNLFDLRQVHKHFLLFEDKIDNSTALQCTETIHADQSFSKFQKHQMNSLFRRSNSAGNKSDRRISKECLNGLRNSNMLPNNENKSLDQTYLQKKGTKSLKLLKKKKKKPRKTITIDFIDLTGDYEVIKELCIPCEVKRKKTEQNSVCLKVMKEDIRSKKHPLKYSGKLVSADVKECSNEDNKSLGEKIRLERKPVYDKISNSTENYTSFSSKSSLGDVCHINLQNNEHLKRKKPLTKNQMSNSYLEFVKEDKKKHDYNLHHLKSSMFIDQNIKEFKVAENVSKEGKSENCVSSYVTVGNATSSYNDSIIQSKEALTSQEESAMKTINLCKTCQNNITNQHSFKQELPTSTNCVMQESHKCCNTMPVNAHFIIEKLQSINDHSSQITEIMKQSVCQQVNKCPKCCTKIDCKPFNQMFNNDITAAKAPETLHNTFNDNENIKLACDTNIINTQNDRNKCVHVVNHIDEHVMTVHAGKRVQCLDKSNDACTVSTTFTENGIIEPKKNDCDSSILDYPLRSSKSCTRDINSFEIGSNAEVDYDLKSFPKMEEANEITETDYNSEYINFLNIPSGTLEDFFGQSSEINYNNLTGIPTKKPYICTDNDNTAVKTLAQDTLHNIFNDKNDDKTPYDTNIIYTLGDRDNCIYVTNHTGEHVMTVHAEKRVQCLDKSNDACTVSTTFTENGIIEPQQKKNDCDSSILDYPLRSSISCTFDINSFEIGSNAEVDYDLKSFPKIEEANEITETDYNSEHINFLNIQSGTLLEDFFGQSSEINCNNLTGIPTKKPYICTDNDNTAVKTLAQGTLHNIFNDKNDNKTPYDTNIICTLGDRDNCIYVTNHTGEHMTTSAEKRMQCLDNSKDVCTVSTTFTGDKIIESSLDACQRPILIIEEKHVNSDNRRKYDYGDDSKCSEATMKKQQGKSDCNTSMSDERLYSSELCTFDIDSFEIDSKETNELMNTDCINDFGNISFIHNIQDVLSSDTSNFFLPKQSLFDFDNIDTPLDKKNVVCNNQNDAIDSSIDLVASHLNADNTFLRLPAMEFRYSF